jgi:hypothetical protein
MTVDIVDIDIILLIINILSCQPNVNQMSTCQPKKIQNVNYVNQMSTFKTLLFNAIKNRLTLS